MIAGLSRRERRTLIGGFATIALLVIGGRGGPAWWRWQSAAITTARESRMRVEHARTLIADHRVASESLVVRRARLHSLAPVLVDGSTSITATAALASIISEASSDAGVRLSSVQPLADSAQRQLARVAVSAQATGDIRGVARLLASLESGQHLLAVRSLTIHQPDPTAPPDQWEELRVEMLVEGRAMFAPDSSRR